MYGEKLLSVVSNRFLVPGFFLILLHLRFFNSDFSFVLVLLDVKSICKRSVLIIEKFENIIENPYSKPTPIQLKRKPGRSKLAKYALKKEDFFCDYFFGETYIDSSVVYNIYCKAVASARCFKREN